MLEVSQRLLPEQRINCVSTLVVTAGFGYMWAREDTLEKDFLHLFCCWKYEPFVNIAISIYTRHISPLESFNRQRHCEVLRQASFFT